MSGLYGTTQAYNPIAGNYLALAPNCGDTVWGTTINYCDLTRWGIYDGQENDPAVLQSYAKQMKTASKSVFDATREAQQTMSPTSYSLQAGNQRSTIGRLLDELPHLSKFNEIVKRSGWLDYIDNADSLYKVTLFAPNNQAFEKNGWENLSLEKWNKYNLRSIAQAHTLPFGWQQETAYGRKFQLYTSLPSFQLFLDGTGEVQDNLNFYIPPNRLQTLQLPSALKRINLLQGYYTNNGALYEIDGVFNPNVIVY